VNAAYNASDVHILITAGKYFLQKPNAEVETALAYFERACDIEHAKIDECDQYFRNFLREKEWMYPQSSLAPYIKHWEKFARKINDATKKAEKFKLF
jgi:hypothetical protein